MKILHATKKYPDALGGDAVVVANLEKQQLRNGHRVVILTTNCDEILKREHIHKFGLKDTAAALDAITPRRLFSLLLLFFSAYKILRNERPDIIHTHSIDIAFFISFAARHYRIPIVHTFHIVTFNDPKQSLIRQKTELLFLKGARPAKAFVLNPSDVNDFKKAGVDNVAFVPNGVSVEEWSLTLTREKSGHFTFVAVGRLEEQKGFHYLIAAAAKLQQNVKGFQIKIVGDGSQREQLQKQIDKLNLGKRVLLMGRLHVEQIKKLYASADVFVLSSLYEGMPLTLLEAWAARLPTIATPVSILKDAHQAAALMVKLRDEKSLASAMKRLIDDTKLREGLSKRGSEEVKKYTWEKVGSSLDSFYDEATA